MSDKDDSRAGQRRIDAAAKAAFLAGLRRGESREDAAFAAGFSLMGFYNARARDPAFKAEWTEALATSAAAERRVRAYADRAERAERGELRIASANRRIYQRRWHRNVRFTAARQAVFLAHFAMTCDTTAAAAAAGVSESTVTYHCRNDPAFAEAYAQALQEGYAFLEAKALRLRLAAQKKLRAAIEGACPEMMELPRPPDEAMEAPSCRGAGDPIPPRLAACPECNRRAEEGAEFDRIMKLLARRDRKPRRPDSRFKAGGRRQRWTFEEAIGLLDKKLRALGLRTSGPPPDIRK